MNPEAAADAPPSEVGHVHQSRWQLVGLSLYWLALAYLWNSFGTIALPLLVQRVAPPGELNTYLGNLEAFGLLIAALVQPTIGFLSDRTLSGIGRRKPYVLAGTLGDAIFLFGIAFAGTYGLLFVFYALLQMSSNVAQGPYQAMLPDRVPTHQRGQASGLYGVFNLGGTLLGFAVISFLISRRLTEAAVLSVAVVMLATMLVTVLFIPDRPWDRAQQLRLQRQSGANENRRSVSNFLLLLVSRFFIFMGISAIQAFSAYYIEFVFFNGKYSAGAAAALLSVVIVVAGLVNYPAGMVSDRVGRKLMVGSAATVCAVGCLLLFGAKSLPLAIAFGAIVGVGFGMFFAVDWALIADLVPKNRVGFYMGISNIATAGAASASKLVAGPLIDHFNHVHRNEGYHVLFLLGAAIFILAAVSLVPVRSEAIA